MSFEQSNPNPYASDSSEPPVVQSALEPASNLSGRETYNIVTDTVVGMNVRKSDNVFQLKVIGACLLLLVPLGVISGAVLSEPSERLPTSIGGGAVAGLVALIVGLFGSGIYLMIYRAKRHWHGKHD